MQLKKLMIEVMVFFVLGCFLCACGKTKDQTRKTTKDANKEIMIGGDNYPPFNYTDELSLIHISEPTRRTIPSRMPSSA